MSENEAQRAQGELRKIHPIGANILEHPDLQRWFKQGYAKQERDGLWLHYTAICTLLKDTHAAGAAAENEACAELRALRNYKKRIDSAWTAGMLLLIHQVEGPQDYFADNFVDDLRDTMREAEREYMNNFGAEAIRAQEKQGSRK